MNTKTLNAFVLLIPALLTACAVQEVRLESEKFQAAGKNMTSSTHTKDMQFYFNTIGDQRAAAVAAAAGAIPVFGVLGAAIAGGTIGAIGAATKSARFGEFTVEKIAKDNSIVDPKFAIEKTLTDEMTKKYKIVYSGNAGTAVASNANLDDLVASNPTSPYILDVSTVRWVLTEGKEDEFAMNYSAKLTLVDTANKAIVAQGICAYNSTKTVVELPKLKANDASQFNSEITAAVSTCIDQFSTKTLVLKDAPAVSASR